MSATLGAVQAERRQTQVEREISGLDIVLADLQQSIHKLQDRLAPVLVQEPPSPEAASKHVEDCTVALAAKIRQLAQGFHNERLTIDSMIRRCEV